MNTEKEFAGWKKEGGRTHSMSNMELSEIFPMDELLHAPAATGHYSSTETSYFGFNIPEHQINGEIYVWFHPVLKVMSSSVYIWKGIKRSTLAAEYINHYHFLPLPETDFSNYCIEALNLRLKVLEPLKRIQLDYHDADRNVSFSLMQKAIMPPGGRPDGYHFTQAMKVTGDLNLFGTSYKVNGFFSRDRSWSQERRESAQSMPPISWMVGVFDEGFAFHLMAFDDPTRDPEWKHMFPSIENGGLFWGYVYHNGKLLPVRSASKRTHREDDGLAPKAVEIDLVDAADRRYSIIGTVQARLPWQTWQAMNTFFCQTRWECEGHVGYGDLQDVQFNAFTNSFAR